MSMQMLIRPNKSTIGGLL